MSLDLILAVDEDGQPQYFSRDTYDAFVAVGLIQEHEGAEPTYRSGETDLRQFPELARCDFCHERPVTWDIEARTFDTALTNFTSIGGWAACEACGQAVRVGDRAALQVRVHRFVRASTAPSMERVVRLAMTSEMLDGFWAHYVSIKPFATPYRVAP